MPAGTACLLRLFRVCYALPRQNEECEMAGAATWVRVSVLALALVVAGCGHWPFHRHAPAAPVPVHELEVTGAAPDTYPQYWRRNTLLLDLSAASGSGSITVKPAAGGSWPVRLRPGGPPRGGGTLGGAA